MAGEEGPGDGRSPGGSPTLDADETTCDWGAHCKPKECQRFRNIYCVVAFLCLAPFTQVCNDFNEFYANIH